MDRVDIPTMKVINQRNESRFNDMNASISRLKEAIDAETNKTQKQNENLMQLQDRLKNIEKQRGDFQQERQRLAEQVMKLNEKIDQCIADTNKMERRFDEALKMEVKSRNEFEKHFKQKCDEDIGSCQKNVEAIKIAHAADKTKYKERLTKINEALANLEKHLETDNKKIDQIITTDIQSRRTHEKGLLAKVIEMEERIAKYMDDLKKMADSMAQGQRNVKTPALNVANLRREMESIATDKSKLSMEGLLKLEERLSNIQRKFSHEHDELLKKLHHSNEADVLDKFKMQIEQLNELKKSVEDANERLRMRVEQQIPNDLSELSAKTDRVTHQLETRINTEHEQRLTDVKQLQNRLNKVGNPGDDSKLAETFNEDLNGCKIAIKKLAESITTVKNVLDLKINDEIEQRKRAVNKLSLSTVPVANE